MAYTPSATVDRLWTINDTSGNLLYTFQSANPKIALPLKRPSKTYELAGVDGGYDPFGTGGNPLSPRQVTYTWNHAYQNGETYSTALANLLSAIGTGQQRQLILHDAAGAAWIGLAKAVDVPLAVDLETKIAASFAVTWELNPPVFRQLYPPGWFFLDIGDTLDSGLSLDNNTLPTIPLTSTTNTLSVTNTGDAADVYGALYLTGPFTGPATLWNDTTGQWIQWLVNLGLYQTLAIDLAAGAVRLNGVPAFDSTRFVFGQYPYFAIAPGVNALRVVLPSTGTFGQLGNIVVNSSSSTFVSTPSVSFSGGGGSGATAHAVMSGGAVVQVILDTAGAGYSSAPTVVFSGGGGTATATATVGGSLIVDFRSTRY